ncbi:MAG: hypothetical protein IM631_05160 [Cytophagales bacterium]|nr:hypothetical protein [Cytophagales bacterium]MCA6370770.1 hypothetical protein [Cytophagales bacterium]MCA6385932.1 hypothetical protein [Cytophagales bacterium]
MNRIIIDNQTIQGIEDVLKQDIKEYAAYRKRNVESGIESKIYAAILVEKYAEGLSKAVKLLFFDQDRFGLFVDDLCYGIDPEYKLNLTKRNSGNGYSSVVIQSKESVSEND